MRVRHARWYAGVAVTVAFGTTLVVYSILKATPLLEGPVINIASPVAGIVYRSSTIAVIGTARNLSRLTLDGRQIFVDERGIFREMLIIPRGYTILEVVGEDRFGRERRSRIEIVRD